MTDMAWARIPNFRTAVDMLIYLECFLACSLIIGQIVAFTCTHGLKHLSERLVCQLFSPFKKETVNVFPLGQFLFFMSAQAYMSEEWDVLLVILRRQCSSKLYRRREEVIKRAFSKKKF